MLYQPPVLNQKPLSSIVIQLKETPWQNPNTTPSAGKEYTIAPGDSLTTIAQAQGTSVERIWRANSQITNPDKINVGEPIKIPSNDEVLPERAMISTTIPSNYGQSESMDVAGGFSVPGNSYTRGFCTWYVKNVRPELPNNLGNADTWFSKAANQGLAVGYTPQVGAVAVAINYTHVAVVTAVHGSTVTISEMNYRGFGVVSSRDAPISEFRYIL